MKHYIKKDINIQALVKRIVARYPAVIVKWTRTEDGGAWLKAKYIDNDQVAEIIKEISLEQASIDATRLTIEKYTEKKSQDIIFEKTEKTKKIESEELKMAEPTKPKPIGDVLTEWLTGQVEVELTKVRQTVTDFKAKMAAAEKAAQEKVRSFETIINAEFETQNKRIDVMATSTGTSLQNISERITKIETRQKGTGGKLKEAGHILGE